MRFGFLITARCNASCTHCAVSSGPHQTTSLPTEKILDFMDQAAEVWRRERLPGESLLFSISGGEPFLDMPRLLDIVRRGSSHGAIVTCVTNGSWASSDERARSRLADLKDAGLHLLAVSVSRFHREFIRRERVQRILDLAPGFGIRTGLKCVVTASDRALPDSLEQWARSRKVDELEVFPVLPYLRDGASLPEGEYVREVALPKGTCPVPAITVREDGRAYTCCMPGAFNEFLSLGSAYETPLQDLYDRFYLQGRQQVLRFRGPIQFAKAVIANGEGHRLRERYEGVCDLCAHITSDPVMARVAERVSQTFARRRVGAAVRKLRKERARVASRT